MAHNQDALSDKMCQAARDGLNEVCTMLQLRRNPEMAGWAESLGKTVKNGLADTHGKEEVRIIAQEPKSPAKSSQGIS